MIPEALRRAEAHVFVADLEHPVLGPDDRHHLERVLRLRPGAPITVTDGRGSYRSATWGSPDGDGRLDADGPAVASGAAPGPRIWLAALKTDRVEWAVQKLTEIGASEIGVFQADRCVVRWDGARREKAASRFARIAREAAMQSRRCSLPTVAVLESLDAVVAHVGGSDGAVRAEPGGASDGPGPTAILIGPEGGWSPREADLVPGTWDLGGTVLRAETAAIVAGVRAARQ